MSMLYVVDINNVMSINYHQSVLNLVELSDVCDPFFIPENMSDVQILTCQPVFYDKQVLKQYQHLIKHVIGVATTVCKKSRNAKCFLLTTVSNDTITQWMVNEIVKAVIINIRRLTVCSSNLNVNAGMNLVPLNKMVTLIELMYYEQMCYKYSALSSMLEQLTDAIICEYITTR